MRRNLFMIFCLFLAFVLQSTAAKWIAVGSITPNLIIILVSVFGFTCGSKCGLVAGFFTGLLWDLFYCDVVGLNALIFMYIGFLNGSFKQIFFKEDIKLPIVLITASDLMCSIAVYIIRFLLRGRFGFPRYFATIIMPEILYTVIITMIIYPLISRVLSAIEDAEIKRSSKVNA